MKSNVFNESFAILIPMFEDWDRVSDENPLSNSSTLTFFFFFFFFMLLKSRSSSPARPSAARPSLPGCDSSSAPPSSSRLKVGFFFLRLSLVKSRFSSSSMFSLEAASLSPFSTSSSPAPDGVVGEPSVTRWVSLSERKKQLDEFSQFASSRSPKAVQIFYTNHRRKYGASTS